jgi:cell wall-associated NlpC family hydrolase
VHPRIHLQTGQAAIELLGVLPALAALALLGWYVVAAAHGIDLAGGAARAGARAAAVGAPAERAARATLPDRLSSSARVTRLDAPPGIAGVRVALPPVAAAGPALVAEARAAVAASAPGARAGPAPSLVPFALAAVPGGGRGVGPSAARAALAFLGVPYLWGGESPAGFDCSGLVHYVYARLGVVLPRVAEDQARVGAPVTRPAIRPGDAVFFADASGYVHHEGLALGGDLFVHAPHTGDVVRVSSLSEPYYARQFAGARRY